MFEEISFPEHEYESIQNYLNRLGYCYTTRVYKEIRKYSEDMGLPYEFIRFIKVQNRL